jgi:glucose/arabinose dehydrogenase
MRWRSLPLLASLASGIVVSCSSSVTTSDTEVDPTVPEVPDAATIGTPEPPPFVDPVSPGGDAGAGPRPPLPPAGPPVETRPPNGQGQTPAFPEQTRAPSRKANVAFTARVVASGLQIPWSLAFLPDGAMLVTERPGRMRIVALDGAVSPPLAGVPVVFAEGQGGLFDVALDPAFTSNGVLYFSYAEPRTGGNGTAVARAKLVRASGAEPARLSEVATIWRSEPTIASDVHFGGRLVVSGDGNLFVTTGERGSQRAAARELGSTLGKVVRITPSGAAAAGNPFIGRAGALPEIWSLGHRNPQAAALNPLTGELWIVEHGARGGDEVNVVRAGKDYGWAMVTYGTDYDGQPIGGGITSAPGIEQPVYYWDPSIAPSGMAFYEADRTPAWKGSLFVGALAGTHLARLTIVGDRVVGEERLLEGEGRVRDVRVGPGGTVFVTNESKGTIVELVPSP